MANSETMVSSIHGIGLMASEAVNAELTVGCPYTLAESLEQTALKLLGWIDLTTPEYKDHTKFSEGFDVLTASLLTIAYKETFQIAMGGALLISQEKKVPSVDGLNNSFTGKILKASQGLLRIAKLTTPNKDLVFSDVLDDSGSFVKPDSLKVKINSSGKKAIAWNNETHALISELLKEQSLMAAAGDSESWMKNLSSTYTGMGCPATSIMNPATAQLYIIDHWNLYIDTVFKGS